ncbi:unnamed protein product [Polarella glacialis]|uniref:Uncharacterized protein n=1 Tax=Polarella glacialis TaxID=89957 RepID=A0A813I2J1_POLGL|nr:unnamed protein product [Polarella glacialis]
MGGMGGGGGGGPPADPFPPVKSDVKLIACSTCKALARRLHSEMSKWDKKTIASEEAIRSKVTQMCDSSSVSGAWLRELDMVESSDGKKIELKRQSSQGYCEVECKTIELACKAVLEESEIDLVVGIYKSFKLSASCC